LKLVLVDQNRQYAWGLLSPAAKAILCYIT